MVAPFTAKRLLVHGKQVETSSSGCEIRVVSELPALPERRGAAEAGAALELLVALAGEGRELALARDGVCEQLVRASVVAQVSVGLIAAAVS